MLEVVWAVQVHLATTDLVSDLKSAKIHATLTTTAISATTENAPNAQHTASATSVTRQSPPQTPMNVNAVITKAELTITTNANLAMLTVKLVIKVI
jgi:hypothetical protein